MQYHCNGRLIHFLIGTSTGPKALSHICQMRTDPCVVQVVERTTCTSVKMFMLTATTP
jgi:hypothetical protein